MKILTIHGDVPATARTNTERGGLGHIDPDAIKSQLFVPYKHLISPPLACSGAQPVWEDSVARPDIANVLGAIGIHQERVGCISSVVRFVPEGLCKQALGTGQLSSGAIARMENLRIAGIVGVGDVYCRVDDRDVVLTIRMQF